jgi:DNA topoisomerase VI subunit B
MSNASQSGFDLERTIFSTPRAAEFLERRALETQTGQPAENFGDVVIKELGDNGLDAAETAGVIPVIKIYQGQSESAESADSYTWVEDNGPGMPPELIDRILDFDRLVSDKAAYRSPARGAQGNALKTVLGTPFALGIHEPVIIEACGVHHEVTVGLDPGGNVVVSHPEPTPCDRAIGTRIGVPVEFEVEEDGMWARRFAAFNPHAMVNEIEPLVDES